MQRQAVMVFLGSCLVAGLSLSGRAQDAKEQAVKQDLQASKDAKDEAAKKVDFAKEVMPLFRQSCIECHGAKKQENGMRLDRRSSVMNLRRRVVPGSSANSRVYHRLVGEEYGPQMPPTGALGAEQVAIIKAWIDQGADWPDALANEMVLPPLNRQAVAMVDLLRSDDLAAFLKAAQADPNLLNARGPEGSTPFMYAVLYADTATLAKLLKMGADSNQRNDANATALMWAARHLEKTRLLVDHGADVNARSDDRRTPLMIAARRPGAAPIVKFLLEKGANPNPNAKPATESSPLLEALAGGDAAIVRLLMQGGADAKAAADTGLTLAVLTKCDDGIELLALSSTPYATARSLVSLQIGGLPVADPAYQRAVSFLLATQQPDGTWYTKTRALGFQPYFDGSFPHGYDQWISAAATSWAAMALTLALPEAQPKTGSK